MPDSTTIIWGPLKVEKTEVTDTSASTSDSQKVVKISVFDCFPTPGSVAEYVRPSSFSPEVLKQFLQDGEMSDLRAVDSQTSNPLVTEKAILGEISSRLNFRDMHVWYTSDECREMRRITECFITTIYLRVKYNVFQVKITANRQIQLSNKTFPVGDEVATYRVRQPDQFRFETYHEWNERCCPERPGVTPDSETTDWHSPYYNQYDHGLLIPGLDWSLDDYKREIRPRLKIELKYDW